MNTKNISNIAFFSLLFAALLFSSTPANAEDTAAVPTLYTTTATPVLISEVSTEDTEDILEVVVESESEDEETVNVADFSDDELTEAEPSELPDAEEDEELTKKLHGKMLLDVEGNGEVYYVDPVTGGKEYLANGSSAQKLLERRALGINEENFAKLTISTEKEDPSICKESKMGKRLRGRIVLRVEKNGEAYWINPENCKAYYAGTHEASYELMKKMSLGIKKKDLAKVKNNKRQNIKTSYRYSLFAYAEDKDLNLSEARKELNKEVKIMTRCLKKHSQLTKTSSKKDKTKYAKSCVKNADIPRINKERKEELKETIKETRIERNIKGQDGKKKSLQKIKIKELVTKIQERRKKARIKEKESNQTQNNLEE